MKKISIVIPVFNQSQILSKTLKGIFNQTYPKEFFEIIVVDNGSKDNIKTVLRNFDAIIYLKEDKYLNSPYSARNRGVEIAKGDIIVFVDATCIPVVNWLEEGVKCMVERKADIIGGNVRFDLGDRLNAAKIFDSLTNVNMKESIIKRKVAKTGNLFVKRDVFNLIGKFPEGIRSGGDVRWTKKATNNGMVLDYCENSFVTYKARGLKPLIKKQWRVGKGQPTIWKEQGLKKNLSIELFKGLIPPGFHFIDDLIKRKGKPEFSRYKFKIYLVAYIIRLVMIFGNIYGSVIYRFINKH